MTVSIDMVYVVIIHHVISVIIQLFVCCNFLLPLLNYISILLGKYSGYPVLLDRKHILFNVFHVSQATNDNNMLLLLVNLAKTVIWKFCNTRKHEKKIINSEY